MVMDLAVQARLKKEKVRRIALKILARVFIFGLMAFLYLPIFILAIMSFSSSRVISFKQFSFSLELYQKVFESAQIQEAARNSFLIALISASIATILGSIACVGINAATKRIKSGLMMINQIPVVNAEIVTAVALMLLFTMLGLQNNGYVTLILAHTLICLPFVVLSVLPRLRQLNPNLFEAAQDLGATPFVALTKVIIPQIAPAMLSGFVLGFTLSLDDFIITQFNSGGVNTISTVVYSATKKGVPPEYRALSTIIFVLVAAILVGINLKPKNKHNPK